MWRCPDCETKVDDNLAVCWNCGTSKRGQRDPGFIRADDYRPPRGSDEGSRFGLFSLILVTSVVVVVLAIARISQTAGVYVIAAAIVLLSIPWVAYAWKRLL